MKAESSSGNTKPTRKLLGNDDHLYHIIHKVPYGDTPYVRAKHAQIIEKNLEGAVKLFKEAITAGDRTESALKDMAVVLKQLGKAEEAIDAIKSFSVLCSKQAKDSLDNVLLDLYKKCGRIDEHIDLIKQKLRMIYRGAAFNGKLTKTARSHGKKFQVSIKQEISRLLGNMGWAYMQKTKFMAAEVVYKKAQMIDPDGNKACNLAICLIRQGQCRYEEARSTLENVLQQSGALKGSEDGKTRKRAQELLQQLVLELDQSSGRPKQLSDSNSMEGDVELERCRDDHLPNPPPSLDNNITGMDHQYNIDAFFIDILDDDQRMMKEWRTPRPRRLPIFEEISSSSFRG